MKILYAANLAENDSALYRAWALRRLGHEVTLVNLLDYSNMNPWLWKVLYRLAAGPHAVLFNRELRALVQREKPDLLWGDKLLWIWPSTLKLFRRLGIVTVSYMIDNPFGPRRDPGWRIYMKNIPLYDLHVVQRTRNIADYKSRGARDVIKIQTAYEPTLQYPPPAGWSDKDRNRDVSFIGTSYDDRPRFLTRLHDEFGVNVAVSGGLLWKKMLGPKATAAIYRNNARGDGEYYLDEYREGIWRSKINLSFITHSNQDEFVHKSFEIAGCGGFLLAERSEGHMARFEEDVEAVFFTGIEECVEKIRRYLPDEEARTRIAAAGRARAERDGYHNDRQVGLIVERAESILAKVKE